MLNRSLRRFMRLLWRFVWRGLLAFALLSVAIVLLFSVVPPPGSMVMVERKVQSWINSEPIRIQGSGAAGVRFLRMPSWPLLPQKISVSLITVGLI